MGKDKGAQRTKGNLKPSSSGRSAELLGGVTGFVGFGGLADLGYVPAATQGSVEDDTLISAEFRVTLRKMTKKDATTKIKALQEFELLCATEEVESLKTVLPYWPRLFSKLCFDCERRVREAVQSANLALTSQIGKQLAPYLRPIMPSWLLSMTDPHTPAAIAALKSFQNAFSEEKRPGVLIFCSQEIFDNISENLFVHTPQTLSDPKNTIKEEQGSKYIRVVFCSLKGLSLFLEMTSKFTDKKAETISRIQVFLEKEKFWNLCTHESSLIRSAWYDVIKSLFEYDVEILRSFVERLSKIIFSSLDSPDTIVLPHIWITFLHLCVGLPECWNHCGNSKSIFNRIFAVLRDGGRGCASEIYPQLLPILSVLPTSAMEDETKFYIDFFRALSTSLQKERLPTSRRDVSAIIIAMHECLKYMSKRQDTNKDLWDTLIKYQVVELLLSSFSDGSSLIDTNLYHEISKLLYYWSNVPTGNENGDHAGKLGSFWDQVLPQYILWIDEEKEDDPAMGSKIKKLERFFTVIRDPNSSVAKRSKGVRFSNDETPTASTASAEPLMMQAAFQNDRYKENYLNMVSNQICPLIQKCYGKFVEGGSRRVYKFFAFLLHCYSSDRIYKQMVKNKVEDPFAARKIFLEELILPLVEDNEIRDALTPPPPVMVSIDIIMDVYSQMTSEHQQYLLMNLKSTLRISALKLLVERMSSCIGKDGIAALWLKSPPLGCRLVKCTQHLCAITLTQKPSETSSSSSSSSSSAWELYQDLKGLVTFVFSNGHKQSAVFSLEYLSQMLTSLKAVLKQLEAVGISATVTEADGISTTVSVSSTVSEEKTQCQVNCVLLIIDLLDHLLGSAVCWEVNGVYDAFKALFALLYHPVFGEVVEVKEKLQTCILKALDQNVKSLLSAGDPDKMLIFSEEDNLFLYIIEETKSRILNKSCSFATTVETAKFMEKLMLLLFEASPWEEEEDCKILLDHSLIQLTLSKLLPCELLWSDLELELSPMYATPVIMYGSFICREFPLPKSAQESPEWNHRYVRVCLFIIQLLLGLVVVAPSKPKLWEDKQEEGNEKTEEEEEEEGGGDEGDIDAGSLSLGQFTRLVVLVLHGTCHSNAMVQMNLALNNNSVSDDVRQGSMELSNSMHKLLDIINIGNKKHIVKLLRDRCSNGNISWCVTFGHVLNNWIKVPLNTSKLIAEIDEDQLGITETKQILLPYLPVLDIVELLGEETTKLSSSLSDPYTSLPSICLITTALEHLSDPKLRSMRYGNMEVSSIIENSIHSCFSVLTRWRDTSANIFLFATDLAGVPWEDVSLMVSIIRLLTVVVKNHSILLLHSHWDVTLCALSAWIQSLLEASKFPELDTVVAMFTCASSKCTSVISELIGQLRRNEALRCEYPPTLTEEWEEFYAPSMFNTLMLKFIQCTGVYEKKRSIILYSLCRSLAVSVGTVEASTLIEITYPPLFNALDEDSVFKLPDNLQFFLNHFSHILLSPHPLCQYSTYSLLKVSLPEIMSAWEKNLVNVEDKDDLPQRPLPHALMSVIQEAGSIVEAALLDRDMGCWCEMVPHTDMHTYCAGYLLAWKLVLMAITHASEANQQLYSSYIRECDLLPKLLNNLFKLMPLTPELKSVPADTAKTDANMFNTNVVISPVGKVSSETISWLACQVYLACLTRLPAAVRTWFTNLDRNTQPIVDRYTSSYVSPIIIATEINTINESTVKYDNMTIKSRPGAREIITTYTIDEASMELVLRMAPNHPLSIVVLDDHKRVGVSIAQWRNWLFGLNTMLSHRNTPLLNSLEFWKKNVDQKFEGIEECFICYYVLHGTNHQIPKLLCRTCKKKFHSACLYKWFSTSNNSTCPICRSLF